MLNLSVPMGDVASHPLPNEPFKLSVIKAGQPNQRIYGCSLAQKETTIGVRPQRRSRNGLKRNARGVCRHALMRLDTVLYVRYADKQSIIRPRQAKPCLLFGALYRRF